MSFVPDHPLPLPDEVTAPFWEACLRHELVVQHCAACAAPRFPPRPMCPRCQSFACHWQRVSGRAEVFSFVICHPPVLPAFRERTPYVVAVVELAELPGLRMIGNLLCDDPAQACIGLPVEVRFEEVAAGVVLPQWCAVAAG